MLSCLWLSPNTLVAAGHGCKPVAYKIDASGEISFLSTLESDKGGSGGKKVGAMAKFQNLDKHGSESSETKLTTTHQNQISCIQILSGNKDCADKISTSGGDGKVVVWELRSLEKQIAGLKI